jgi:hypothetical protein
MLALHTLHALATRPCSLGGLKWPERFRFGGPGGQMKGFLVADGMEEVYAYDCGSPNLMPLAEANTPYLSHNFS